jgi:hypothetical protein
MDNGNVFPNEPDYTKLNLADIEYQAKLALANEAIAKRWLSVRDAEAKYQVNLLETERIDINYPLLINGFFEFTDKPVPNYLMLAKYMKDELGYLNSNGYEYLHNGTHYEYVHRDVIKNKIVKLTLEKVKPFEVNNFYNMVTYLGCKHESEISAMRELTKGKINLSNGVYDIETKKLGCHHKDYFFNYVLPYDYNPDATCPKFDAFLLRGFNKSTEYVSAFYEILGYILEGGPGYLQKAFILFGKPNSGKSTALEVISKILGKSNVANIGLDQLEDKFIPHTLNGKLSAIVDAGLMQRYLSAS